MGKALLVCVGLATFRATEWLLTTMSYTMIGQTSLALECLVTFNTLELQGFLSCMQSLVLSQLVLMCKGHVTFMTL